MGNKTAHHVRFFDALLPILVLLGLVINGLIIRPHVFKLEPVPLEVIFILAATFAVLQLCLLGFSWLEIERSIVSKLSKAMPAFFILFSIGLIISSWIICGTIPMLVYYGLKLVNPTFIYLLAFLVPAVFSTLTGTSWGSAGAVPQGLAAFRPGACGIRPGDWSFFDRRLDGRAKRGVFAV